jgi:DNA-binding CsgD family transcriptional regulator
VGDVAWAARLLEEAPLAQNNLAGTLDSVARGLGFDFFCVLHSAQGELIAPLHDNSRDGLVSFEAGIWILLSCSGERLGELRHGKLFPLHPAGFQNGHDNSSNPLSSIGGPNARCAGWRVSTGDQAWSLAFIGKGEGEPLSEDLAQDLRRVIVLINQTIDRILRLRQAHLKGVFDGLATARAAAILINVDGKAGIATPSANRLFGLDFGIRDDRLWSAHTGTHARLQQLADLACWRGADPVPPFLIDRYSENRPIFARPLRLPSPHAFTPSHLLLFLSTPGHSYTVDDSDLQMLFGLSKAEARIASLLAEGFEPQQIAEQRKVSVGTIRVQMKHIFQKAKVHRQAELIKVIAELRPPMEMAI